MQGIRSDTLYGYGYWYQQVWKSEQIEEQIFWFLDLYKQFTLFIVAEHDDLSG